ncbi:acyl carrier protein [Kitasatospora sp. LaBMicrA B282]|uniref:acyl carrier protein n=1 Tax=Kitasatospora sp. LaBMicrA B282 TaxID=3420949 RepID=UPI003D0AA899
MSDRTDTPEQFVLEVLADKFGVPQEQLAPDATLKSLGLDSLGGVELSLAIKKRYGVAFVAGELRVDFTVADIAQLTTEKLAAAAGGAA